MSRRRSFHSCALFSFVGAIVFALFFFQVLLFAQGTPASALKGFGMTSREPIVINADRLEISQKKNEAVYSGNVTVVQGDVHLICGVLTIRLAGTEKRKSSLPQKQDFSMLDMSASNLKNLECTGDVRVSRDKLTAGGTRLLYEGGVITLTGEKVVLSDGKNIQTGRKLTYDTLTDRGIMEGGRVRAVFTPETQEKTEDLSRPALPSTFPARLPSASKDKASSTSLGENADFFLVPPTQP